MRQALVAASAVLLILVSIPVDGAYAQGAAAGSGADEGAVAIEEITVTAQRREEQIQDVPISVTAMNAAFLIRNNIENIEELSGYVPSLYTTNSVNYGAAPVSIRGIGGANGGGNFFNDEPVAVYLNDMYIGRLSFSTSDLVDLESVQVLRGPQGTLFGRNATAGALLVQTARPTMDPEGFVRLGIAEHGEQTARAAISGPLADNFQARLAVGWSDRDGWGTNTFNGEDVNGSEDLTTRLSLAWQPTSSLSLDLMVERQDQEANPATINVASVAPGVPSSPFDKRDDLDAALDDLEFRFNDPEENDNDATNAVFSLSWDLGAVALDAITGYRDYELTGAQDSDSTEFQLFNNNGVIESDQFSQEVRLSSTGSGPLSWAAGAYYYQEDSELLFIINNFQGLFGAGTNATFDGRQDLSSWAVFADATWDFAERWSLTLGGRFSQEDKEFENKQTVFTISDSFPLPVPFGPFPAGATIPGGLLFADPPLFESDEDFSNFSPRVVVEYDWAEDSMVYLTFSQGFKSGGFNSFGLEPAFTEEEIDAWEVGIKSTLLDRRLRLNAAWFFYDYTNLQVRLPVPTGGVSIDNAGEASVSGLEVEASLLVTDRLRLDANFSYLDTELDQFDTQQVPNDLQFLIGAPIPLEAVNAAGNELTRAPEFSFFLAARYDVPLAADYRGTFELAYRYQDEVFFLETNQTQDTFAGDSSDRLDARFSFGPRSQRWEGAVYVKNVTDDRTITQVSALGSFPNAAVNAPQQWGAEFTYRWD